MPRGGRVVLVCRQPQGIEDYCPFLDDFFHRDNERGTRSASAKAGPRRQDQLGKAFVLDGANPAFRECVQIRALGRKPNGFDSAIGQRRPKRFAEFRVAIMQNITAWVEVAPGLWILPPLVICAVGAHC